MNRVSIHHFRPAIFLSCMVPLLLGMARPAHAQSYVEGVSAILGTTNSSEIDTWSETFETPDLAQYYGAYVAGYLFQNGSLIAQGVAFEYPAVNDAAGGLSAPVILGDEYEIDSYHYLVAFYSYVDQFGVTEYENPDEFLFADSNVPDFSGTSYLPGGGPPVYQEQDIFLGVTGVAIVAAAPTINSISPTSDTVGNSGQLTINGDNLIDAFTQSAAPAITGSGFTFTIATETNTQVVLSYMIALNASTGDQSLTVSSHFGTSNAVTFRIGDLQPVISAVTPDIWNAGETTSITLTGTGFGTNPSLNITGPGVTNFSITDFNDNGQPNGATIHASVTVDVNSPGGDATLEVTSHGYNGTGFLARKTGDTPVANNKATIDPAATPPPQIIYQGKNISEKTVSPYAGQQISLTVNPPSGFTVVNQQWSIDQPSLVTGGYDIKTGTITPVSSNNQSMSYQFYAVIPLSQLTVMYSYTLKDSSGMTRNAVIAHAFFSIGGPDGVTVDTKRNPVQIVSDSTGTLQLELGNFPMKQVGIAFTPRISNEPNDPGAYSWVQLLNDATTMNRSRDVVKKCVPHGFSSDTNAKLDDRAPYFDINHTSAICPRCADDSPAVPLKNVLEDLSQAAQTAFDAQMYLLWTPPPPNGCNSSATNCAIPVPLGYVHWTWTGEAINQSVPPLAANWMVACKDGGKADPFQQAKSTADYPTWKVVSISGTSPNAPAPDCTNQ